jgi:hypothetical protein
MPAIGEDDPGRSYRRGYQDGAVETFRAIERFLDVATREVVRTWIERDVNDWRLKATLSHPPTWRLNKLNAPNSNWDIRANFRSEPDTNFLSDAESFGIPHQAHLMCGTSHEAVR